MISFIVPTIGRSTLAATLASIECRPGDEIIVVGQIPDRVITEDHRPRYFPCMNGNDWGGEERRRAIGLAHEQYLAFIDDDDTFAIGHRLAMSMAITGTPDRPVIFRMRYPNGSILWSRPELRCGNVGSPMTLVPNDPTKLGTWSSRREGDFDFLRSSKWIDAEFVWRPEIVAELGHDDP